MTARLLQRCCSVYLHLILLMASLGCPTRAAEPAKPEDRGGLIAELGLKEAERPARDTPGWRAPRKVILAGMASSLEELQSVAPGVEFVTLGPATRDADIADADAAIGVCTPDLLAKARRLRWIQLLTAGVDQCMTVPAVHERQLLVTNMQRVQSAVIGEHAIALVLALARNLDDHLISQQQGRWDRSGETMASMRALKDKTLLVVGLGGIGTEVAKSAHALGMKVTATRASGRQGPPFVSYVGLPDELLRMAADADVIVNAAPLTAATTQLFDARFFAVLKPTAYFVNVGRGQSVVTSALIVALNEKRLAGAGLDVTDPEPLPADHPLWRTPNVIITPHTGGASDLPPDGQLAVLRENLRRYAAGEKLLSVVNLERGY